MTRQDTHSGVVVGVDGSSPSRVAIRWAAHEAAMRNAPLTLVHVIFAQGWGPAVFGGSAEPSEELQAFGRKIIDDAVKVVEDSLQNGARPQIDREVVSGPPVATLVDLSKDAQLAVVGRRGRGLLDRVLLGSVSTGLVYHARCPVAVVHQEDPFAPQPSQLPVLVGIDGSPASELATAIAFDEASRRDVGLIALHAWSDADVYEIGTAEWSAQQAGAVAALAERLAGWQERYPDVSVDRRIVSGHPALHLIDQAQSSQLVVVGSRGRGGFAGMLLGSVSTAVVNAARIPVIVARQH
ncbi:universal stress protein [Mycobacterium noviomagense]|uniref:Universal stress protein n=1 Tax=Mycobacterium noviomagense TaxID=459858 RepID=A0A7I7PI63_9MYCO|nr:universal stress protein [Mycobacterium noviomagense]ORB11208.1 universal stress protein UspA [Mycobacterium noviomagense]BBY08235.1 universal stress protein [Mycobacterium noviomagense]